MSLMYGVYSVQTLLARVSFKIYSLGSCQLSASFVTSVESGCYVIKCIFFPNHKILISVIVIRYLNSKPHNS